MRVTQMTFYRQTLHDMLRQAEAQFLLNYQISSGRRINQPSDDPVDNIWVRDSHRAQQEITQYKTNVAHAKDWLKLADGQIASMIQHLTRAKELAEQMSTGTYTADQREQGSLEVQAIISQLIALGNSEINDNYIFAGTRTQTQAVTSQMRAENPAPRVDGDLTLGKLYGQGNYTGHMSRVITFTVNAAYAGGVPAAGNPMLLDYQYRDDQGNLVTGTTAAITGVGTGFAVNVADGIQVYAEGLNYAAGDQFTLTVGRLHGNSEDINVNLSTANRMTYNYRLQDLWGAEGYHDGEHTNLIDKLVNWQRALANDDTEGQGQQTSQEMIPKLEQFTARLLNYQADAGAKLNRLEVRQTLLGDDHLRLNDRLAHMEDTDVTKAITDLKMYQILYQATLQATSLIASRNLSDYL